MDEVSHLVWRRSGGQSHQPHAASVIPTSSPCRCSEDEDRRREERGWPLPQATTLLLRRNSRPALALPTERAAAACPGPCPALGSSSAPAHRERKAGIVLCLAAEVYRSPWFCNSWERNNISTQPKPTEHCWAVGKPLEICDQREVRS